MCSHSCDSPYRSEHSPHMHSRLLCHSLTHAHDVLWDAKMAQFTSVALFDVLAVQSHWSTHTHAFGVKSDEFVSIWGTERQQVMSVVTFYCYFFIFNLKLHSTHSRSLAQIDNFQFCVIQAIKHRTHTLTATTPVCRNSLRDIDTRNVFFHSLALEWSERTPQTGIIECFA